MELNTNGLSNNDSFFNITLSIGWLLDADIFSKNCFKKSNGHLKEKMA